MFRKHFIRLTPRRPFRMLLQKTVAAALTTVLIFASCVPSAVESAAATPGKRVDTADAAPSFPPGRLGAIDGYRRSGNGELVICIQDLHCDPGVQENIAGLIEWFALHWGVRQAGVEGACGTADPWELRRIPWKSVRLAVSKFLLQRGKIGGAEFAAANGTAPLRLIGVDDANDYRASLAGFMADKIGLQQTFFIDGILCAAGSVWFYFRLLPRFQNETWPLYFSKGFSISRTPPILGFQKGWQNVRARIKTAVRLLGTSVSTRLPSRKKRADQGKPAMPGKHIGPERRPSRHIRSNRNPCRISWQSSC